MQEPLAFGEPPKEPLRRYFYDFEYIRLGPFQYYPISLAIVPEEEDGEEFYVVFEDYLSLVPPDSWEDHNVIANLGDAPRLPTQAIADLALKYFDRNKKSREERVEIWSCQDDHDRHLFCELFGGQSNNAYIGFHDRGIRPVLPRDIVHLQGRLGWPSLPAHEEGVKHNALNDAKWHRTCFNFLKQLCFKKGINPDPILPYDFLPRPVRSHDL